MSFVNNKKEISMKKILFFAVMLVMGISYASAQSAQIKFDKTTHDFRECPEIMGRFVKSSLTKRPMISGHSLKTVRW